MMKPSGHWSVFTMFALLVENTNVLATGMLHVNTIKIREACICST